MVFRGVALVVLSVSLSLLAAPAQASTVEYRSTEKAIVFTGAPGEANDIWVQGGDGINYTVSDFPSSLTAGTGCTNTGTGGATCVAPDAQKVIVNAGDGNDKIYLLFLRDTDRCIVPELNGDAGNDQLQSNNLMRCSDISQDLDGGPGDDQLVGGNEYEHLDGGAGRDTVAARGTINLREGAEAGPGTVWGMAHLYKNFEVILADEGPNRIIGTDADETISGGGGDDIIDGGSGADTISGGAGYDYIQYLDRPDAVTVRLGTTAPAGGASDGAGDTLSGFEGVVGGLGNDVLVGDAGDNTLNGGRGADLIDGGAGTDWVSYGERNDTLEIRLQDAPVSGSAFDGPEGARDTLRGIENVRGGWGRDWIYLNDVPNIVDSGQALDVVYARGGGVDTIDCGEDRFDTVYVDVEDLLTRCEIVDLPQAVTEDGTPTTPVVTTTPTSQPAAKPLTVALAAGKLPKLALALSKGVLVTGTCSGACRLRVELKLDAATARRLGLKPSIGTGTAAASGKVTLRFTSAAKRTLKKARQLKATLTVTATGADGKVAVARRTVTLKR